MDVRVNMGKDFSRDSVELTGLTDPGSYIAFSGVDYDWYTYGAGVFLTENQVSWGHWETKCNFEKFGI